MMLVLQVMMVMMHNTREVPAEWQIKAPMDAAAAADWSHFKCEPEQGLVAPGDRQLLKVRTLTLAHIQHHSRTISITANVYLAM